MSLEQPPPGPRASDRDRERAASMIQEAHSDGRLDFEEMDQRLTQIYSAKTQLELKTATADLVPVAHGSTAELVIKAKHSAQKREGAWTVPERITAVPEHSSLKLDFTDAVVQWPEVQVEVRPKHSSVLMIVPEGWIVDIDQVDMVGSSSTNKAGPPKPGAVRLRVTGEAKWSSIVVRHPRKRRWWWPWYRK